MAAVFSHRSFARQDAREEFLGELFDRLWERYRSRVSYVRDYEKVVEVAGATFHNDHIAFRTIALQKPCAGIHSIARIFESLGYSAAAYYLFPEKHLGSIHYQHSNPKFPKLFISELKTAELSATARRIIRKSLATHRPPIADDPLAALHDLGRLPAARRSKATKELIRFFSDLPWKLPERRDVETVNEESQFGAWVLVHGYDVNHFTASVNSHGPGALENIEKTVDRLRSAGIPMKREIEGAAGTKLRQSATEAVFTKVSVMEKGKRTAIPWTYAYFEIAERGDWTNPETGVRSRFEGFLGPQAAQLFEMTKINSPR